MKKILLVMMVLLSAVANANKVYDHIGGFIMYPSIASGTTNYFNLGYLATYSTNGDDQKKHIYAAIFGMNLVHRDNELSEGSVVNKVKVYEFRHSTGLLEPVGFIAMDGALYVARNLELPRINIIPEFNSKSVNIIDVLKTHYGFLIVANRKGSFGGVSTQLYNMRLKDDGGYVLDKTGEIPDETTSSGYTEGYYGRKNKLVLAAANHRVFILERGDDFSSSWKVSKQYLGESGDEFTVLTSNSSSRAVGLRYRSTSGDWAINRNITESPDFTNFEYGKNNKSYFDYASYDGVSRLIENGIASNGIDAFNTFNFINIKKSNEIALSVNGAINLKLVSANIMLGEADKQYIYPRQIYLLKRANNTYLLFEVRQGHGVEFYNFPS